MHETIAVRIDTDNPDHHLWKNGNTWWIHYTVHTDDDRQRRVRHSLRTKDLQRARMLRDAVLTGWLRAPDPAVCPSPRWIFGETADPDYRPSSYWGEEAIHANIKGEWRRRAIRDAVESESIDEIPPSIFSDTLPEPLLKLVGRIHPIFMGGEYLPDYLEGEVEIARVSLKSTTGDVFSVRARRQADGIHFRMVDEYETIFAITPEVSQRPITLAEMILLIDGADRSGAVGEGLVDSLRNRNAYKDSAGCYKKLLHFVTVDSEFYPDLCACFEAQANQWLERKLTALYKPIVRDWLEGKSDCNRAEIDAMVEERGFAGAAEELGL